MQGRLLRKINPTDEISQFLSICIAIVILLMLFILLYSCTIFYIYLKYTYFLSYNILVFLKH